MAQFNAMRATEVAATIDPDRFWSHVVKRGPDDCWLWTGVKSRPGYGQTRSRGRLAPAHRVAYILTNGPVAADRVVCHTCNVRACCNPAHLRDGSQMDNAGHREASKRSATRGDGAAPWEGRITVSALVRAAVELFATLPEEQRTALVLEYGEAGGEH